MDSLHSAFMSQILEPSLQVLTSSSKKAFEPEKDGTKNKIWRYKWIPQLAQDAYTCFGLEKIHDAVTYCFLSTIFHYMVL